VVKLTKDINCGHSSVVERLVANEKVEGSNPFARSINYMSELYKKKCIPCKGNIPPFDLSEIHKYLKQIDGWNVKSTLDKSYFLEKDFKFDDFIRSQTFINEVCDISEQEGHHPDILFGWGYAKIKIFTHSIKGLAESDFILASKIDRIKT
jgi:4a-hydroxytetrahydrobiopterin dehydratase|tara:strand:- start:83 stop:535 length:453 start_codon:yes stop_codon:yes gene_type:complete